MNKANNKRSFDRRRLGIACEVSWDEKRIVGFVMDLSPTGLFVRTSTISTPNIGTEVRLLLKGTRQGDLVLLARVVRAKTVRRELSNDAKAGIGLQVYSAPEPFYLLLQEAGA